MAPKTKTWIGSAAIFLSAFFFAPAALAATPLLTGGATLTATAASNYSDNGGGVKIDTATAPWAFGPSLTPQQIKLWIFASSSCTATDYVEISQDGATWLASADVPMALTTTPQEAVFTFTGPLVQADFSYWRLRRSSGSCGVAGSFFMIDSGNTQTWNMVPPTGSDIVDAGFVVLGDVAADPDAPTTLAGVLDGGGGGSWGATEENLCPDTVTFSGGEGGAWGSLADFMAFMATTLKNSFWEFFWVNCDTMKPLTTLRAALMTHAPFRQAIWLAATMQDAINTESATSAGAFVITAPPPFDAGSLTLIDTTEIYDTFGGSGGWGTYVRPTIAALTLLALAFYFFREAQEFFTGQ